MSAEDSPSNARPRAPWSARDLGLLVPFALAVLFAVRGRTVAAGVVGVVGVAVLIARIALGDLVPKTTARVAHAVERGITAVVVAVVWGLIVFPAWTFRRLRRADRPPKTAPDSWWVPSRPSAADVRTFGSPPAAPPRRSLLLRSIGIVVVLMAIDVLVGVAWQDFTRSEVTRPVARPLGLARDGTHDDPRADSPALAPYPWAAQQLREMQRLPQAYWPFTINRPLPFRSETVTVDGWARRSYEPADADGDIPVVAFFGGSTTFGEGQRDLNTIPSEVARLAEEAGTPIRVINYGQRSWTAWQEAMLFEQLTADPDDPDQPDLVVFYDGVNEVLQQQQDSTLGFPTHFNVDGVAEKLTGGAVGRNGETISLLSELTSWYSSRSMAVRVARGVQGALGLGDDDQGSSDSDSPPEVVGADAADVYVRARDFISDTAERRGIDAAFYWQPIPEAQYSEAYEVATSMIGDDTIDISDALDGRQDVFFDQVHTNEVGAQLVAERIWETLEEQVRDAG